MLNEVRLIGNLGQDPERRTTTSGDTVVTMSVATNERWKDKEGQQQERTEWHRVVVFGQQAETCAEHLAKGRRVCVLGSLQTRKWQDKDGSDRWTTEIKAQRVLFLDSKGQGGARSRDDGYGPPSGGGGDGGRDGGFGGDDPGDDIPF